MELTHTEIKVISEKMALSNLDVDELMAFIKENSRSKEKLPADKKKDIKKRWGDFKARAKYFQKNKHVQLEGTSFRGSNNGAGGQGLDTL